MILGAASRRHMERLVRWQGGGARRSRLAEAMEAEGSGARPQPAE
jgi:hypothetical protein